MATHRIGLVVPSSNVTVETELPALLSRHAGADPPRSLTRGVCYGPGSGRPPEALVP